MRIAEIRREHEHGVLNTTSRRRIGSVKAVSWYLLTVYING